MISECICVVIEMTKQTKKKKAALVCVYQIMSSMKNEFYEELANKPTDEVSNMLRIVSR